MLETRAANNSARLVHPYFSKRPPSSLAPLASSEKTPIRSPSHPTCDNKISCLHTTHTNLLDAPAPPGSPPAPRPPSPTSPPQAAVPFPRASRFPARAPRRRAAKSSSYPRRTQHRPKRRKSTTRWRPRAMCSGSRLWCFGTRDDFTLLIT